jgi:hypothetical protein
MVEGGCGAVRVEQVELSAERKRAILQSHGDRIPQCHIGGITNLTLILPICNVISGILPI